MSQETWSPDLDVCVHGDELIVRFDHLPAEEVRKLEAELEAGGVVLHDHALLHCLHVPFPDGLDLDGFEARPAEGTFELRVHLPG